VGQLVPRGEYDKDKEEAQSKGKAPQAEPPTSASGPVHYRALTLLPDVQFSVPLILTGLALWFAWRVVNLPAFADFLIATEAEMNKVSWTTRTRLYQDTIVVLTTVVLLAVFLLLADMMWSSLLKFTGVIKARPAAEKNANLEVPW
jgi:preprotein translocase SecE subunit